MIDPFIELVDKWEREVADPFIFDHLDSLLPAFSFRRSRAGSNGDHWASRYKLDLTLPRRRNSEKTVVYRSDMSIREQGDFANGIWVIEYLRKDMGASSPYEVYKSIDSLFNLGMPKPNSTEMAKQIHDHEKRQMVLDALQDYFTWNMAHNARNPKVTKTRSYLRGRGYDEQKIVDSGLGFVPSWDKVEKRITQEKGLPKEILDQVCGVRNEEGKTSVGNKHVLSIPYICGGILKGFIFRRIDSSDPPKYIACQNLDRKSVFFNIPTRAQYVVVVEGEFDALTATVMGVPDVVAIGGSDISGERKKQVEDAFARGVERIYLCPDLDETTDSEGQTIPNFKKRYQVVMKSIHTIKDVKIDFEQIYVINFPYPCDPDSYIREFGKDAFIQLLKDAVPYWQFVADSNK